jgi:hypothetical protein
VLDDGLAAADHEQREREARDEVQKVNPVHEPQATPSRPGLHFLQCAISGLRVCTTGRNSARVVGGLPDTDEAKRETRRVVLYLPDRIVRELEVIARREGNGINAVIRRLISVELREQATP